MLPANKMKVEMSGTGIASAKRHRSGTSKAGNDYDMFSVEMSYLGGAIDLLVEKEDWDKVEENHTYEFHGDIRMDGYQVRFRNITFTEVK